MAAGPWGCGARSGGWRTRAPLWTSLGPLVSSPDWREIGLAAHRVVIFQPPPRRARARGSRGEPRDLKVRSGRVV